MPKYTFASKDPKIKQVKVVECSIKEIDKIIEDNEADWILIPTAPAIVAGVNTSGRNKPSDAFRDKLKEIQKTLPNRYKGNINTF